MGCGREDGFKLHCTVVVGGTCSQIRTATAQLIIYPSTCWRRSHDLNWVWFFTIPLSLLVVRLPLKSANRNSNMCIWVAVRLRVVSHTRVTRSTTNVNCQDKMRTPVFGKGALETPGKFHECVTREPFWSRSDGSVTSLDRTCLSDYGTHVHVA